MKINFEDIEEQDIVTLIAWFVKNKENDIVIHTPYGYNIEIKKVNQKSVQEDYIADCPIICPVI